MGCAVVEDGSAAETAICRSRWRSSAHQRVLPSTFRGDIGDIVERLRLFENGRFSSACCCQNWSPPCFEVSFIDLDDNKITYFCIYEGIFMTNAVWISSKPIWTENDLCTKLLSTANPIALNIFSVKVLPAHLMISTWNNPHWCENIQHWNEFKVRPLTRWSELTGRRWC